MIVHDYKDGAAERLVLTAMITDPKVLARIAPKWTGEEFGSKWSNLIGSWCVRYHKKHGGAPKQNIQHLHAAWLSKGGRDEDTASLVGNYLSAISEEYGRTDLPNSDHVIDLSAELFNRVKIKKTCEASLGHLEAGRLDRAQEAMSAHSRVEMGLGSRIDFLNDPSVLDRVFNDPSPSLIRYPGALGYFFADQLVKEAFVCFMGPEKSGKSWWLLDLAWRALLQRKRVAFFEAGDMSERQMLFRFLCRASRHPYRSLDGKWPCKLRIPTEIKLPEYDEGAPRKPAEVTFKYKEFAAPLDRAMTTTALKNVIDNELKSKKPYLYQSVHPNSSINPTGIRAILKQWALEDGWTPDVVCVDYADILAPEPECSHDERDRVNTTFKKLRAISQEFHCLLASATQADADSYERALMTRKNFSEDHRKLAHVTGLAGINITSDEKRAQVCRLNWIVLRDGEYHVERVCHVAQCLGIANPAVRSVM